MFYQLLPTTSVGNEYGQQMRIQILIPGFIGLKRETNRQHAENCYLLSLVNQSAGFIYNVAFRKYRWGIWDSIPRGMLVRNLVPRALFPGFGGGALHYQKCPAFKVQIPLRWGKR